MATSKQPLSPRSAKSFYVILFLGRTGSSYLMSLLNSIPEVLCYPEILVGLSKQTQSDVMQAMIRGEPIESYLPYGLEKEVFPTIPLAKKLSLSGVGFKTKLRDVKARGEFRSLLSKNSFNIVTLCRRNIVNHAVSYFTAADMYQKFKKWNATESAHVVKSITIDQEKFAQMVSDIELATRQMNDFVDSLDCNKLEIYYEDLLTRRDDVVRLVVEFATGQRFGGGELEKLLKTNYIKSTSRPGDVVLNFRDLRASFRHSHIHHMFE